MTFNWKKTAIVLIDACLAVYLVLAITAFNRPDEVNNTCNEVKIHIEDGLVMGFLNANEVKGQLQRAKLYPLGDVMENVNTRKIEETLMQNPFVEHAQCYKTQTGRVHITLSQRMPVIRVKADNALYPLCQRDCSGYGCHHQEICAEVARPCGQLPCGQPLVAQSGRANQRPG